jgi:hypothetical protein
MPKSHDEIKAIYAEIDAQKERLKQDLIDYHARYGPDAAAVLFKEEPDCPQRPWHGVMVSPYTGKPGKVRLSYFDANGFSGHEVFDSEFEALLYYREGWTFDPERLDRLAAHDAQFQRGNAYALALENLRARCQRQHVPSDEAWAAERALRDEFYPEKGCA